MVDSVLSRLKPCKECGQLTYNYDSYCDVHPSEPEAKDAVEDDKED